MNTCSLDIQGARIEFCALTGGITVYDHASEIAHATSALCSVFAAQHFKDGINAFSLGKVLNGVFIINLFIVDAVLQAE